MTTDILDEGLGNIAKGPLEDSIRWWEKKRLLFNIVVAVCGLLPAVFALGNMGFTLILFLVGSIFWGLGANALYCAGFMLEALSFHYLKTEKPFTWLRWTLFICGLGFSSLITLFFSAGFSGWFN